MIKSATAYTYEIDDKEIALVELKSQLNLELLKNSVGIIMCDPEFIESGMVEHLASNLGFPTVGATTSCMAVKNVADILMLTIMVLTSDDVCFEVGQTDSLSENIDSPVASAYQQIAGKLCEKPKLIIAFPPLILKYSGDYYVDAFEKVAGRTPVFGTLAVDDTITYENSHSVCNGVCQRDAMSFVLISGNVNPRFVMASISDKKTLSYTGEITEAEGNRVKTINDMKAVEYFEKIGLAKNGVLDIGVQFIPFLMNIRNDDCDDAMVVRALVQFDDDGVAICRGTMYNNSIFKLGVCDKKDVFDTTIDTIDKINQMEDVQAVLIFSCIVRRMAFGVTPQQEAQGVIDRINSKFPMMLAYAGGEICPTSVKASGAVNRFHNYSIISCIL